MKTRRNGPASPSHPIRKRAATATSPPTKPGPKRPRAGTRENVDPGNEEEKHGPRRSSRRKKTGEGEDNEDDKDDDDDDDDTGGETTGDEEDEEDEGEGTSVTRLTPHLMYINLRKRNTLDVPQPVAQPQVVRPLPNHWPA
ncbi:hypothetical protein DFP72DRAFT_1075150 [Ephemerocybe angulata]|uniref:Uncharacterized protein n=1 Tax=Ephemerocybe angulata TaxID=980116 RepID=A0A8H6LXC2_9AGAR|nr:hypothetical protein DFP72DRAFT_1075150 [Tulosesus angulatus]